MEETFAVNCVDRDSQYYPGRMKELPSMPKQLYVKGCLPSEEKPVAAIVGARMCSAYGRIQAFRYARELSAGGVQVISGMALGIDSEAHRGALEGGTPTWAVLGTGVDVCYPARNRPLYHRILRERGGVISQFPPGTPPKSFCFPARNRVISALADIVLVVEAKENSGSLITAGFALDMGKPVFAIPGPVTEGLSLGCHKLIYDGAGIAYSPEILLSELGISFSPETSKEQKNKLGLARDLNIVYSCFDLHPENTDLIVGKTGFPPGKVSRCLTELVLLGYIRETGGGCYEKTGFEG